MNGQEHARPYDELRNNEDENAFLVSLAAVFLFGVADGREEFLRLVDFTVLGVRHVK